MLTEKRQDCLLVWEKNIKYLVKNLESFKPKAFSKMSSFYFVPFSIVCRHLRICVSDFVIIRRDRQILSKARRPINIIFMKRIK